MAAEPLGSERRRLWEERLIAAAGWPELQAIDPALVQAFVLPLLDRLERPRQQRLLLLALNGPVGAGKTSLGRLLVRLASLAGVRLAVASIDDLYLPWPERRSVLAGNPFGVWRVPPGSHDLPLLLQQLADWRRSGVLRLPRFDKTLAGGQGDRCGWSECRAEALVLEGWLMGCRPLGTDQLEAALAGAEGSRAAGWAAGFSRQELEWLPRWDRALQAYVPLWQECDGLWLLRPSRWSLPRRWRLQAEARQRRRGGGWLSAAQVEAMVRATLHSLPPALYQDPLAERFAAPLDLNVDGSQHEKGLPLEGLALLDGRRRWLDPGDQASVSSASSAIG